MYVIQVGTRADTWSILLIGLGRKSGVFTSVRVIISSTFSFQISAICRPDSEHWYITIVLIWSQFSEAHVHPIDFQLCFLFSTLFDSITYWNSVSSFIVCLVIYKLSVCVSIIVGVFFSFNYYAINSSTSFYWFSNLIWFFPVFHLGCLRYKVDFQSMQLDDIDNLDYDLDDY